MLPSPTLLPIYLRMLRGSFKSTPMTEVPAYQTRRLLQIARDARTREKEIVRQLFGGHSSRALESPYIRDLSAHTLQDDRRGFILLNPCWKNGTQATICRAWVS